MSCLLACRACLHVVLVYMYNTFYDILAGFAFFKMLEDGSRGERVSGPSSKKWEERPCILPEITEEEVFKLFRGKEYPVEY